MRIWCLRAPLLQLQVKTRRRQLGTPARSHLGLRTISSLTWIHRSSKWRRSSPSHHKIIHLTWCRLFSRIRRNSTSSPHITWMAWIAPAHRNNILCRCMTSIWAPASSLWNRTKWIFNTLFPTMVGEIKFLSLLAINPPQSSILNKANRLWIILYSSTTYCLFTYFVVM